MRGTGARAPVTDHLEPRMALAENVVDVTKYLLLNDLSCPERCSIEIRGLNGLRMIGIMIIE